MSNNEHEKIQQFKVRVAKEDTTDDNQADDDKADVRSAKSTNSHHARKHSANTDDGPAEFVPSISEWNITDDDFYNITAANHTSAIPVEPMQSDTWPVTVIAFFLGLSVLFFCAHRFRKGRSTYQQIQ